MDQPGSHGRALFAAAALAFILALPRTALAESCVSDTAEEIKALEFKGALVNVRGQSLAEAEALFAPEFISIDETGHVKTREQVLRGYEGGRFAAWASSFDLTNLEIKVTGDIATVLGAAEAHPLSAPPAVKLHFRYLNVWTRSDGVWRLSATQFSQVAANSSVARGQKCSAR